MYTKQKQREDEIKIAAIAYSNKMCKNRIPDKFNMSDQDMLELAFIAGAMFADDFPRQGLVEIKDVEFVYELCKKGDCKDFIGFFKHFCKSNGLL